MLSEKGEHYCIETEVPRRPDTYIVVAVAIPVVDVEAVLVEVADTRHVADVVVRQRGDVVCLLSSVMHWRLSFTTRSGL